MMCKFLHDVFVGAGIGFIIVIACLYAYWQVLKEERQKK
jgi:hypothetical protein